MSARNFQLLSSTKRRFGNVTVERGYNGFHRIVSVVLHNTCVASFNLSRGSYRLDTGGHHTRTTATAINTALRQAGMSNLSVVMRQRKLYVHRYDTDNLSAIDPAAVYRMW